MIGPSRIPIRPRLTLAFAISAAIVLAATSLFLLGRLLSTLDEAIDDSLLTRATDVAGLVEESGVLARPDEPDEGIAQIIGGDGELVTTTGLRSLLLTKDEIDRAAQEPISIERRSVDGVEAPLRLLARPIVTADSAAVLVVAASLDDRDEAVKALVHDLLLVAPVVLLLVSGGGWLLAGAALRPVESMRAEAAAISGHELGRRLTLPPADDEIRRLGATLNDMLGRLGEAIERERRFVADASHELRSPLAVLQTELELALRRPRGAEELEAALRSAADEADRLSRLADDLLVLARADDHGLPLYREPIAVHDLFERVAARFAARAAQDGTSIEQRGAAGHVVDADPMRLEQALGNLVDNALRHGRGPIELRAESAAGMVGLHVVDAGDGFTEEFIARAFDRFSRADDSRGRGGTGLGLAIAAAIAEAHGGSAHAANRTPGADVWLSLPARGAVVSSGE